MTFLCRINAATAAAVILYLLATGRERGRKKSHLAKMMKTFFSPLHSKRRPGANRQEVGGIYQLECPFKSKEEEENNAVACYVVVLRVMSL